jgi:hypothetical protein
VSLTPICLAQYQILKDNLFPYPAHTYKDADAAADDDDDDDDARNK